MSSDKSFDIAPHNPRPDVKSLKDIAKVINNIMNGKINTVKSVTLATSATTTSVTDANVSNVSFIGFMPTTANAAAEIPTMYISARGKENFTITHTNNTQADRTFVYSVLG